MQIFELLILGAFAANICASEKTAKQGESMTSISRVETYKVFKIEGRAEKPIGTVYYADHGRLSLADAEPSEQTFLKGLIEEMNAKESLQVEAPAPAGSPKFAQASRTIKKGGPGYFKALSDYLLKYHDIKLKAAGKSKTK